MKDKKKPNVILYTIFMIIMFFAITELFIWGYGSDLILNSIFNYPQGSMVISEAVLLSLSLIVLLVFKNSYVFTQKKEKITKGLFYGLYYIIGSILLIIVTGIIVGGFKGGLSIINILIGCLLIGLTEEFLCRGFLLNEFLERYGDSKKGVWYSIIISGVIFGLLHLFNITYGQNVFGTIFQAISAIGSGIVFGLIYYKTKNIWSVVILHALWDFSLMLGLVGPVYSNQEIMINNFITVIFAILALGAELLVIIPYIKDIDKEPKKSSVIKYSVISIVTFLFVFIVFAMVDFLLTDDYGTNYKYDNIEIKNYSVTRDNYDDYYINYDNYAFKLEKKKDNVLILSNMNTKNSIEIKCNKLIDYIIMEQDNDYIIAYEDFIDTQNSFLNYVYINKSSISNEESFMRSVKNGFKKYMLSDRSELLVVNNRANKKSYLAAYSDDYGYYLLTNKEKMAILNRD